MGYSVYIHVPFCRKSRCPYCDFYSEVIFSADKIARFANRLLEEIDQRIVDFESLGEIDSIFFGGGTPSVFPAGKIERIIERLNTHGPLAQNAEVTIECNPEDINADYCRRLLACGVNRLSVGVQSLDDGYLKRLGRVHGADKALEAIGIAKEAGFENISADLIFAGPGSSVEALEYSVGKLIDLGVTHISAYGYHLEQGAAAFGNRLYAGSDDESYRGQYLKICELLNACGWRHYEISNWAAAENLASSHNLAYWTGRPYLGLGPSAHSYLPPATRISVPADLKEYFECFKTETEKLGVLDIIHERLMLALRLDSGIKVDSLLSGKYDRLISRFEQLADRGYMLREAEGRYVFTENGWLLYDTIVAELFEIFG